MKIYVVTQGEYSSYHIIGVTTDPKVAEVIKQKFNDSWGEPEIEVFEDAEFMLKPCWRVNFTAMGYVKSVEDRSNDDFSYRTSEKVWEDHYKKGCISTFVQADNIEAAVKIAAEQRAKYLAEKAGIA